MRAARCRWPGPALATLPPWPAAAATAVAAGGDSASATVTVQRRRAHGLREAFHVCVRMNPTNGAPSAPGGDLMLREKSSPSAPSTTSPPAHAGQRRRVRPRGVVRRPADRLLAALPDQQHLHDGRPGAACTGRWNLWEYTLGGGRAAAGHAAAADRQHRRRRRRPGVPARRPRLRVHVEPPGPFAHLQALGRNYLALDEYERERVLNLHTMAADGSGHHSRSASTRATTATR
jgi:hypothetical protein